MKEGRISPPGFPPALRPQPGRARLEHAAAATPAAAPGVGPSRDTARHAASAPGGHIRPGVTDPEVSLRDETSASPREHLSPPRGHCPGPRIHPPPQHDGHLEKGTMRNTWWHLCDPEGPQRGRNATENRELLRARGLGVFPLRLLTHEGRARCWQGARSPIHQSQLSRSPSLLTCQNQEQKMRISKLRSNWSCA